MTQLAIGLWIKHIWLIYIYTINNLKLQSKIFYVTLRFRRMNRYI